MIRSIKSILIIATYLVIAAFYNVQATPPVKLGKPEITKINWNMRSLVSSDMNNDGLSDLVLINNQKAKVEILLQRKPGEEVKPLHRAIRRGRWEPVLEDSRFIRENLVSGTTMYALASGDINSDGLMDLVYTGKLEPLNIHYQLKEGGFSKGEVYDNFKSAAWTSTIAIVDVDDDGKNDLVVMGKEKILIFYQGEKGLDIDPLSIQLTTEVSYGLKLIDINKDEKLDILYLENSTDRPLRVRFQRAEGGFGPELSFSMKAGSDIVHPVGVISDDREAFVHIQAKTQLLEIFTIEQVSRGEGARHLQPRIYTLGISGSNPAIYGIGDFTGGGQREIVAVDSKESSLLFFPADKQGAFGATTEYPTLAHVTQILAGDFDGSAKDGLLVFSDRENIVGYSEFDDGRFQFPQLLDIVGEPQALAVGDVNKDGISELIVLSKEKKKYTFYIMSMQKDKKKFESISSFELKKVVRSPKSIRLTDIDGDGNLDMLVIIPREPARVLRQNEENAFDEIAIMSSVRKSLLSDLSESRIGSGDVDGDKHDELLIVGEGFVRAVRVNENSEFEIVDQYNARSSDDKIKAPLILDIDNDGQTDVVFYDQQQASLQVLNIDEDGVYRYSHSIEVGKIDPIRADFITGEDGMVTHLIYFGTDRFWSIPLGEDTWELKVVSTYEKDLQDVTYNMIEIGDLNNDKKNDILMIDGQTHLLEVLTWDEEEDWSSRTHYTVFDKNMHYQGRKGAALEPREVLVGDFTNDGLDDVAMLVHDRVLVYPQLKSEK